MGVHRLRKQHSSASSGGGSGGGGGGGGAMPPKGWMAIRVVARGEGEEGGGAGERFLVPVGYLRHPLFVELLREAEEEYGFAQKGAITIPCGVDHFRRVQGVIEGYHHGQGHHHGHGHHHHHFHIAGCFRA